MRLLDQFSIPRSVKIWLITGLVMIFIQIIIGGVTRLTGSGLSITKWQIVTGTLPPFTDADWVHEFDLYKNTPQYLKINQGMELKDFKFIYFWEYFHRLWARLMLVVFMIPFGWFLINGKFSKALIPKLLVVVLLAGFEGFLGWIMVASGLIKRPWVNAYNLTMHLTMALIIYTYLLWTTLSVMYPKPSQIDKNTQNFQWFSWSILIVCFIQIALGAMMSGTKAGLLYPTWPDMNGDFLPSTLLIGADWNLVNLTNYDSNAFTPTLIQFFHRNLAYILTGLIMLYLYKNWSYKIQPLIRNSYYLVIGTLFTQILLGIFTILSCKGSIPVVLGSLHQGGAVLLLTALTIMIYHSYARRTV